MIYFVFFALSLFYMPSVKLGRATPFAFSFLLLPIFVLFVTIPSLQYGVGTDYFSYAEIYEHGYKATEYLASNEYLFFYLIEGLKSLGLGYQWMHFSFYLINASCLFLFLFYFGYKQGNETWLLFLLVLAVSGVFFNQMNTLRQHVGVFAFPLILAFVFYGRYFLAMVFFFLAFFFHGASVILLCFVPLFFLKKIKRWHVVFFAIASPFSYYFLSGELFSSVVKEVLPSYYFYLSYYDNSGFGFFDMLPKLYYVPIFLLFLLLYNEKNDVFIFKNIEAVEFFKRMSLVWATSCFTILLALKFDIAIRVYQYFVFFYCFPIYYVLLLMLRKRWYLLFFGFFAYVILPFFLKITIFAKAEYIYESIL